MFKFFHEFRSIPEALGNILNAFLKDLVPIDFDEIYVYAPVVRYVSIRLLLALAVKSGWSPMQLDIKAAFLYGELQEEIYMELPPSYQDQKGQQSKSPHSNQLSTQLSTQLSNQLSNQPSNQPLNKLPSATYCMKLNKSIYGFKQSPWEWYTYLTAFLQEKGLQYYLFNPCVLTNTSTEPDPQKRMILDVYIDDITLFRPSTIVSTLTQQLQDRFQLPEVGKLHYLPLRNTGHSGPKQSS